MSVIITFEAKHHFPQGLEKQGVDALNPQQDIVASCAQTDAGNDRQADDGGHFNQQFCQHVMFDEQAGSTCDQLGPLPTLPEHIHPHVKSAMLYIEGRLTDSTLRVSEIARALGLNTTYLSHLFSGHAGERMSRYISARRIALAKRFLATTDWQIKRVAYESGHANADWFSQVFHCHTGMTPGGYRRRIHKSKRVRTGPRESVHVRESGF